MTFTPAQDEWAVASVVDPATGPAVTPGNLVIARAIHRAGTSGRSATISDNGTGNVWHPIGANPNEPGVYRGVAAGGSGDLYMWYCVPATPFTSVSVAVDGGASRILFVREWAGNATTDVLVAHRALANPSMSGPLPAATVTTTVDGCLITGALGATVSNRTFTLLTAGYTAGREYRQSQMTLISASRPDAPSGSNGPQWELGGTSSTTGLLTGAFRPATTTDPDPDPQPARVRQLYGTDGVWRPATTTLL